MMTVTITPKIHELACAANKAANAYRDAVDRGRYNPAAKTRGAAPAWEEGRILAAAVDALTTAIADEEA